MKPPPLPPLEVAVEAHVICRRGGGEGEQQPMSWRAQGLSLQVNGRGRIRSEICPMPKVMHAVSPPGPWESSPSSLEELRALGTRIQSPTFVPNL